MRKAIGAVAALLLVAAGLAFLRGGRSEPLGVTSAASAAQEAADAQALLATEERPEDGVRGQVSASARASAKQTGEDEAGGSAPADGEELGCVVFGRVTGASGVPLGEKAQCQVSFENAAGDSLSAEVAGDGAYSLPGLAPGRWLVTCGPSAYRGVRAPLEIPAGVRSLRHDIALDRANLVRVKVTAPDGRPFWEALREQGSVGMLPMSLVPMATREPPAPILVGVPGHKSGHYEAGWFMDNGWGHDPLPAEYLGTLVLDGAPPVYVSLVLHGAVLATELVAAGEDEAAFVLEPETLLAARSALRLCLVEAETAEPIAGAQVMLWAGQFQQPWPRTDAKGCAVFSERPPGTYELWVLAEGREQARRSVTLTKGETFDLGTLELAQEVSISGSVVDGEGRVDKTSIELGRVDPETREVAMVQGQFWQCDRSGFFRIAWLGPGEFVVRASLPAGGFGKTEPARATANHLVSTLAGSVEDLELPLLPQGRLLLRGERPDWESLSYQAFDGQGLERGGGRLLDTLQYSVDLPRGPYRVVLRDAAGALLLERALELGEEPVVLDVPPY